MFVRVAKKIDDYVSLDLSFEQKRSEAYLFLDYPLPRMHCEDMVKTREKERSIVSLFVIASNSFSSYRLLRLLRSRYSTAIILELNWTQASLLKL